MFFVFFPKAQRSNFSTKKKKEKKKEEDRKLLGDRDSRRRDRRFDDLEPAASYSSEEHAIEPDDCICRGTSSVHNEVFTMLDVLCYPPLPLREKKKYGRVQDKTQG